MMKINQFIDTTYLKTPLQAKLTESEDLTAVKNCIQEAINQQFKLVMILSNHVQFAKKMVETANANVLIGTVIDFPAGGSSIQNKINEAAFAIAQGADELDFVINYQAFKKKDFQIVIDEILTCTEFCLSKNKTIKWIIEVAALSTSEITAICQLLKQQITTNFSAQNWSRVFVKSSTGFYKTLDDTPNGTTNTTIKLMIDSASPLPIKAAGGVKTYADALTLIAMGVERIGTSNAINLINNQSTEGY